MPIFSFFSFFLLFSFFLSWMRWGVRNLIDVQFAVSSFYTIYEPLPHAAYWMFFNLDGHTFFFSDIVKRGHIQAMLCSLSTFFTPLGRFFYYFLVCFRTLEAFWESHFRLIILATLQWFQLLPCDEKCFWNKWKKKISVLYYLVNSNISLFSFRSQRVIKVTLEKNVLLRQTKSMFQLQSL